MFKNAPRRASALATGSATRAAFLALVLGASACSALAGFVDSRPAPAAAAPAAAEAGSAVKGGAVATPVGGEVAAPAAAAAPAAQVAQPFTVSRSDKTIREALAVWARRAGWTHDPEHWTVPFDLPVLSSADLGSDFKGAVRALLSSTDLTNLPLQPCFYSNKVLRVVPKAELCDRMAAH
ncbi:toxin co-regulated pilus biosynthesis Q family protein [Variovorax sp. RA8]|uniref:toxin co-regulated pilus biosynthesis Q family protein n=1 Tax=Variovorax sp. (strain JCM 16519 / RA8) TaxID=662548 RepID=UPI001317D10B|nr:toxin co-regulated pilus biosynthesis Q family protein [Variovorax sp. RA8]VTU44943.1 Toxin co-regulated pilus biosynthesis protein Q [Variovorax sp. RA8]